VCRNGPARMRESVYCTGYFLLTGDESATRADVSP